MRTSDVSGRTSKSSRLRNRARQGIRRSCRSRGSRDGIRGRRTRVGGRGIELEIKAVLLVELLQSLPMIVSSIGVSGSEQEYVFVAGLSLRLDSNQVLYVVNGEFRVLKDEISNKA
jgi:hypothetical protein